MEKWKNGKMEKDDIEQQMPLTENINDLAQEVAKHIGKDPLNDDQIAQVTTSVMNQVHREQREKRERKNTEKAIMCMCMCVFTIIFCILFAVSPTFRSWFA